MDKNGKKQVAGFILFIMALLGIVLERSFITAGVHEVGHWIVASFYGAHPQIIDIRTTEIDTRCRNKILIRAAGYLIEAIMFTTLMYRGKKRSKTAFLGLGGMLSSFYHAMESTDFVGHTGTYLLYIPFVAVLILRIYFHNLQREPQDVHRPATARTQPPLRYTRLSPPKTLPTTTPLRAKPLSTYNQGHSVTFSHPWKRSFD